ncbi:MAG TPA: transferrin-binding protein-like solute binding protein, partial [Sphingomicrobium sp.]|nr:transferrin-binding protein-like solute binding protein [Sphingomicrobium sp.]
GDVPVTGSANYAGAIRGVMDNGLDVWGSISFAFDFGAGTLSGEMKPYWAPEWDSYPLGTYTFTNTVYSSGSTTFSGAFIAPPGAGGPSSFEGRFNGPRAAELMGSWNAPYNDSVLGAKGTMSGVFGGKRGP